MTKKKPSIDVLIGNEVGNIISDLIWEEASNQVRTQSINQVWAVVGDEVAIVIRGQIDDQIYNTRKFL